MRARGAEVHICMCTCKGSVERHTQTRTRNPQLYTASTDQASAVSAHRLSELFAHLHVTPMTRHDMYLPQVPLVPLRRGGERSSWRRMMVDDGDGRWAMGPLSMTADRRMTWQEGRARAGSDKREGGRHGPSTSLLARYLDQARDINYLPSASASRNALDHEQEESPDGEMPRVPSEAIASPLRVRRPGWPSWLGTDDLDPSRE